MSHRVKNLFAIASALTVIVARSAATPQAMASDLSQRLIALSRAHQLVRPSLGEQRAAVPLADLLGVLLGAYDERGSIGDRIQVSVPEVMVGEASITTLALVVHELATNSLKYGALSTDAGTLGIVCTVDNREVVLVWTEEHGPLIGATRGKAGFGSRLIRDSVVGQLGGSIDFGWLPQGVVVTMRLNKALLGA
jgi:two-component sensor histidine kinase